jgi:kinesin family protein 18/19
MTGAGKTHTMFGQRGEPGIANLVMQDLFVPETSEIYQSKVTVSFLEIYNEQVKDLLSESMSKDFGEKSMSLQILEDP